MQPISFFSGLASGIDFQALVAEMINARSRPLLFMESRAAREESRSAAYAGLRDRILSFRDAAAGLADASAFGARIVSVSGFSATTGSPIIASASPDAPTGTYGVTVLQRAAAEKLSGHDFASTTTALGLAGEFFVNGVRIGVGANDSLQDIAARIDLSGAGAGGSGVDARILSVAADQHRIILTSKGAGAEGIDLVDGAGGLLRQLGFLEASVSLKHPTSNGARSDGFATSTTPIATEMGLTSPPAAADVTLGSGPNAFIVNLDLAVDSLSDIAAKINAAGSGSGVTAAVVTEPDGPQAGQRLDISGTTSFTDANGILELLGILEGGRGDFVQQIQGRQLEQQGGSPLDANTKFKDIHIGGVDANVKTGDTLDVLGTRGDGSTFSFTYTIDDKDKFQVFLDALNDNVNGFQAGARTATAAVSADGRLVVTDDQGGESQLALTVVANNENGGSLDFGSIDVTVVGRARQIQAAADAILNVDGAIFERSSNSISDILPGVTLNLVLDAPPTLLTVAVDQELGAPADSIQALVDEYNAIIDYIEQQSMPVAEGELPNPFSGNGAVRSIKNQLRRTLQSQLAAGLAGGLTRLADLGVEIDRTGRFTVDRVALDGALGADPWAVQRLLSEFGETSASALRYLASSDATVAGTYDIDITQAAARAVAIGSGFGGTYVDDATADRLNVVDSASGSLYSVSLADGMTLQQIIDTLNTEFGTALAHKLEATQTLYSDAAGTLADASTTLDQLHDGAGANFGVADGDTITISGTTAAGTAFTADFDVTDVTTQTLGDLISAIQTRLGGTASASVQSGVVTVDANQTGKSQLSLALSPDNLGGGTLTFGSMNATVVGRSTVAIEASDAGGELRLEHQSYGSAQGFDVSFTPGGSDGSASLGLAAGPYAGLDVTGTIGGLAATGEGQTLTGGSGTAVDGLAVLVTGTATGQLGQVTYSRGIAALLEGVAGDLLDGGSSSIDALIDRIDASVERINERIERFEARLEARRQQLIERFIALEEALARTQAQSDFLASVLPSTGVRRPGSPGTR